MSRRMKVVKAEISCNTCFASIKNSDNKALWTFTVPISLTGANLTSSVKELMQKRNVAHEAKNEERLFQCRACPNADPSKMHVIIVK